MSCRNIFIHNLLKYNTVILWTIEFALLLLGNSISCKACRGRLLKEDCITLPALFVRPSKVVKKKSQCLHNWKVHSTTKVPNQQSSVHLFSHTYLWEFPSRAPQIDTRHCQKSLIFCTSDWQYVCGGDGMEALVMKSGVYIALSNDIECG